MEKLPLKRALSLVFLSTLFISGSATLGWFYYSSLQSQRGHDDKYRIVAIVQTGPQREALKTDYFAELLGLAIDKPTNLYQFNTQEAKEKLLSSPLIKAATIKKINPGTLYIDYAVRQPIAYLADYENIALDTDGYLFPFKPFFTPKRIPEFYLGLTNEASFGKPLEGPSIALAYKVHQLFSSDTRFFIRRIDVANAFSESLGQRQIVVILEDWFERSCNGKAVLCIFPRILRLSSAFYEREFAEYLLLRDHLQAQEQQQIIDSSKQVVRAAPTIIDLRIPHLSFFQE